MNAIIPVRSYPIEIAGITSVTCDRGEDILRDNIQSAKLYTGGLLLSNKMPGILHALLLISPQVGQLRDLTVQDLLSHLSALLLDCYNSPGVTLHIGAADPIEHLLVLIRHRHSGKLTDIFLKSKELIFDLVSVKAGMSWV